MKNIEKNKDQQMQPAEKKINNYLLKSNNNDETNNKNLNKNSPT